MKKAFVFLIDALRWDVLSDSAACQKIAPNIAKLVARGFVVPIVANAQSTQFVMPSFFSLSYPLDYGGYNNGIRDRPKSYVELLRNAGFETHLMAPGNQLGITMGYDRGFDTVRTTSDYRTLLQQRLERTLNYELELWRKGERSDHEVTVFMQKEFGLLLSGMIDAIENHDKSLWPGVLHRINRQVAQGCAAELEVLNQSPRVVLDKLSRIAPGIYWRFLGRRHVGKFELFIRRAVESASWRARRYISARTWMPFLPLGHRQTLTGDIAPSVCRFMDESRDRNWYIHMHVMDLHDCRAINRPLHVLGRFRYFPRWLLARMRGLTKRRFLYDSAVMYVDGCLGQLIKALERSNQIGNTLFFVTADHGSQYAESPRVKQDLGLRMHYEHIDVPLVMAGVNRKPSRTGLFDTMSVGATLLDALDIPPHASHKGVSVFAPGRPAVISESCGHGNADLERRDIYFAVTTENHRMMAVLSDNRLDVKKLFDRMRDPRELFNVADSPGAKPQIDQMLAHLYRERAEIFSYRKVA